jgi:hypothetical protein
MSLELYSLFQVFLTLRLCNIGDNWWYANPQKAGLFLSIIIKKLLHKNDIDINVETTSTPSIKFCPRSLRELFFAKVAAFISPILQKNYSRFSSKAFVCFLCSKWRPSRVSRHKKIKQPRITATSTLERTAGSAANWCFMLLLCKVAHLPPISPRYWLFCLCGLFLCHFFPEESFQSLSDGNS